MVWENRHIRPVPADAFRLDDVEMGMIRDGTLPSNDVEMGIIRRVASRDTVGNSERNFGSGEDVEMKQDLENAIPVLPFQFGSGGDVSAITLQEWALLQRHVSARCVDGSLPENPIGSIPEARVVD